MFERPNSNFEDVGDFHTKFGLKNQLVDSEPEPMDPDLLLFRAKFLLEELQEFLAGAGLYLWWNGVEVDIGAHRSHLQDDEQMFDALIDLVYVAMGTAHLKAFPWQEGWNEVQRANMTKVRAQPDGSDSKRGSSFDVVKPEGWRPPNLKSILARRWGV